MTIAMKNAMENQALVRTHKGPGIASFVIGLLSVWAFIGLIGTMAVVHIVTGEMPELTGDPAVIAGLGLLCLGFVHLIGIGLGIFGVMDRASEKAFPALGLVINSAIVALFIAAIVFEPPTLGG